MFGTSGIRGRVGETVTGELALSVGRALASAGYETVVVGRDPRESGAFLADALAAGVREAGGDVRRVGMTATPTIARAVGWLDADAGVAVTASHNPAPDNGIKLWTASGRAFDEAQQAAIADRVRAEDYDLVAHDELGEETHVTGMTDRHERVLVDEIEQLARDGPDEALAGIDVVVDVGNGAGGVTAGALDALGADVTAMNAQPDGEFPGRPSEPTAEHCRALATVVAESDADLGVAHDGDADRTMAVTGNGDFLTGDVLLAIFAVDAVREHASGARGSSPANEGTIRVAAPLNTSLAVDDALADVGATLVRTKVGDGYVAERTETEGVVFGGEMSGAWIWPDATKCPDGPLAACRLAALVATRGSLASLAGDVPSYPTRRKSIEVADKSAVTTAVADALAEDYPASAIDDSDGVRVDTDDGWFLVRASGTQPLVRTTAEAREPARSDALAETALEYVTGAIEDA